MALSHIWFYDILYKITVPLRFPSYWHYKNPFQVHLLSLYSVFSQKMCVIGLLYCHPYNHFLYCVLQMNTQILMLNWLQKLAFRKKKSEGERKKVSTGNTGAVISSETYANNDYYFLVAVVYTSSVPGIIQTQVEAYPKFKEPNPVWSPRHLVLGTPVLKIEDLLHKNNLMWPGLGTRNPCTVSGKLLHCKRVYQVLMPDLAESWEGETPPKEPFRKP